ncbi:GMC family oxidoreductase [Polynucleobacter paneuropaeus]|nr:GMC family oxidoreductase [Polynucleobacter paneuropaeus]
MIQEFDIVVIGSGVGGSSVASRASERGLQALIIDNGSDSPSNQLGEIDISFVVDGVIKKIKIPSVKGAGGNSLIYGGHLTRYPERYWKESSESHIPIDYSRISVYYDEVLNKFNISSKEYNESERKVRTAFESSGFGAEEIIWAVSNHPGCNGCGGSHCYSNCKKDFFSVLCRPLINQGRLIHWSDSTIVDISLGKDGRSTLKLKRMGKEILLSAKVVVFSCGTFGTPAEIVRLFGEKLEAGTVKRIGRGMMFHVSDFFILFPRFPIFKKLRTKLLCSSENFMEFRKQKICFSIQSVGAELSGPTIYRFINRRYGHVLKKIPFSKKLLWVSSHFLAIPLSRSHIIASIVEDPFLLKNHQIFCGHPIKVNYQFQPDFVNAIHEINKTIIRNLKSKFFIFKFGGDSNLNYGHAMGGMSMGTAQHFLVDETCKVKELDNIYVCDASILSHSAATNPSLTIAAMGYHAADCIFNRLTNGV